MTSAPADEQNFRVSCCGMRNLVTRRHAIQRNLGILKPFHGWSTSMSRKNSFSDTANKEFRWTGQLFDRIKGLRVDLTIRRRGGERSQTFCRGCGPLWILMKHPWPANWRVWLLGKFWHKIRTELSWHAVPGWRGVP